MSWLALALTPGVGPARFLRVYAAGEEGLDRVAEILSPSVATAYRQVLAEGLAEQVQQRAEGAGVRLLGIWQDGYPPSLRHLADPPPLLYPEGRVVAGPAGGGHSRQPPRPALGIGQRP